jgi:hypothetical protein
VYKTLRQQKSRYRPPSVGVQYRSLDVARRRRGDFIAAMARALFGEYLRVPRTGNATVDVARGIARATVHLAVARNNSAPPVSLSPHSLSLSLAERRRGAFSIRVQLEIAVIELRREISSSFQRKTHHGDY